MAGSFEWTPATTLTLIAVLVATAGALGTVIAVLVRMRRNLDTTMAGQSEMRTHLAEVKTMIAGLGYKPPGG